MYLQTSYICQPKIEFMKIILSFLLSFTFSFGFTQTLKFTINNEPDDTVHLIKYFGKGLYYADTSIIKNGVVQFDGSKQKPGILGVLLRGQKYFQFIYNNESVDMHTEGPDFLTNAKIKKSKENKVFIPYVQFIQKMRTQANQITAQRSKLKEGSKEFKKLTDQVNSINKSVEEYQLNLIDTHKDKLVSKIVKMSRDVFVPEAPKDANGNITDSNFRFNYFRNHYWDNIDLLDERLVNNPVFHNKLEYYFGKNMMVQHWDTVLYYAFNLCDNLDPKSRTFEYVVGWITSTYGKSKIMGMDKVYTLMLDRYYCSKNAEGKSPAFWVSENKFEDLCDNIKNKKRLVIGATPPNLTLRDTSDSKWFDYYSLNSDYTIIYFWDPECGHCKKITPKLETLYKKKFKDRNVEIFAVGKAVGEEFNKWKKFVKDNNLTFINVAVTDPLYKAAMENANKFVPRYTTIESLNYQNTFDIFSTPKVFVLDKNKKIVAKNISISQLEDMIDHLQGKKDLEKLFPPDPEEDEQMQKTE